MQNSAENDEWKPAGGNIMTRWAKFVSPQNAYNEYPRPQMVRKDWMNLNGLWDYAIVPNEQDKVDNYDGKILVPYPLESALSGVKKSLAPYQKLCYRKTFELPEEWKSKRLFLHFGAVDWKADVYINGILAGSHTGGYCPFSFEITKIVHDDDNEIIVYVCDSTNTCNEQRGKQALKPGGIFYTAVSGIWQTVWIEPVNKIFIERIKTTPDIDNGMLKIETTINGDTKNVKVEASAYDENNLVSHEVCESESSIMLKISSPKLWSPDSPFLYKLNIKLMCGSVLEDEADSYFGMRKISTKKDDSRNTRILLNNEPIFQSGLLDQGYWPDGLYTAPTDEALRYDVEMAKKMGYNMLRKHIKVEPARWYYYCDLLGILVWQDMPSGGNNFNPLYDFLLPTCGINIKDTTSRSHKSFGRESLNNRENYKKELKEMIDTLYNEPCVVVWVPFNESWGQFDAKDITLLIKNYDKTRLVDHASGWYDQNAGDFKSIHTYVKKLRVPKNINNRAFVISEMGGYGLKEDGHVWREDKQISYKGYKSRDELASVYKNLICNQVMPLISKGLCATVYTQITDVETEINGILSYDREIAKIEPDVLFELNNTLYRKYKSI